MKKRSVFILCFLLSVVLIVSCSAEEAPAAFADYLYMVNVGKGDAILIGAGGRHYLIDCGKSGAWDAVESALERLHVNT